jgi:Holliday junction DNA helicase RuvA
MFAYLKGQLVSSTPSQVVIEVQGVGYIVFIPCSAFGHLPPAGSPIQLFTTLVIREFSHALYGFLTSQEREVFDILLNVNGIGPKLALSFIGHLSIGNLREAVIHQDLPALCRVPGVGKKTAERLVVELRDKLPSWLPVTPQELSIQMPKDPKLQYIQDAVMALINLGYNQNTAQKAIKQSLKNLPEEIDLGTLITTALKNI